MGTSVLPFLSHREKTRTLRLLIHRQLQTNRERRCSPRDEFPLAQHKRCTTHSCHVHKCRTLFDPQHAPPKLYISKSRVHHSQIPPRSQASELYGHRRCAIPKAPPPVSSLLLPCRSDLQYTNAECGDPLQTPAPNSRGAP